MWAGCEARWMEEHRTTFVWIYKRMLRISETSKRVLLKRWSPQLLTSQHSPSSKVLGRRPAGPSWSCWRGGKAPGFSWQTHTWRVLMTDLLSKGFLSRCLHLLQKTGEYENLDEVPRIECFFPFHIKKWWLCTSKLKYVNRLLCSPHQTRLSETSFPGPSVNEQQVSGE